MDWSEVIKPFVLSLLLVLCNCSFRYHRFIQFDFFGKNHPLKTVCNKRTKPTLGRRCVCGGGGEGVEGWRWGRGRGGEGVGGGGLDGYWPWAGPVKTGRQRKRQSTSRSQAVTQFPFTLTVLMVSVGRLGQPFTQSLFPRPVPSLTSAHSHCPCQQRPSSPILHVNSRVVQHHAIARVNNSHHHPFYTWVPTLCSMPHRLASISTQSASRCSSVTCRFLQHGSGRLLCL